MKKTMILLILIALAVPCVAAPAGAARGKKAILDFSGVDQFWKIAGILEGDREPSEEEWTALFQTPGYRGLMRHESWFSREFFMNRLGLVFKPSRAVELKEALSKKKNANIEHFAGIKAKKRDLDRLRAKLETGALMDEALRKTREFLPKGAMDKEPFPPVSFIFFDTDARGYVPIIVDFAFALAEGPRFADLLAHESHHYYRNRNLAYDEGNVRAKHSGLFNSLAQLQAEGMADQIDKHVPYFVDTPPLRSELADRYRKSVMDSPRVLASYNELFEQMADQPSKISSLPLVQSGHPTGYFMARLIIDNGDLPALIDKAGNPFAFIYLFNKAALKQKRPEAFSAKAIGFLRDIERMVCPNPEDILALEATPSGLDVSGLDQFWKIADILGRDQDPAAEEWNRLFANPAYQELFIIEGWSRDSLKDKISLVFKPSRTADSQAQSAGKNPTLLHFAEAKEKRAEIEAYVRDLKTSGWAEGILTDIRPFLPERVLRKTPPPTLSVILFSLDSRFGYPVFIFDPLYGLSSKTGVSTVARKHGVNYFYSAAWPGDPQEVKQKHSAVIDTLDAIALGGFMETVVPMTRLKRNYEEASSAERAEAEKKFENAFQPSLLSLKKLDDRLKTIERNPDDEAAWEDVSVGDFPLEGRPAGVLMAKAIEEAAGKERLAAVFGNPFGFFQAFQEAASKQPERYPVFSAEAMRLIESLKKEYARPEPPAKGMRP